MDQDTEIPTYSSDIKPPQHYPVKLTSKSLPVNRATRLRLSWFTLGIVFSLSFNALLSQSGNVPSQQIADTSPVEAPVETHTPSEQLAATSAPKTLAKPKPADIQAQKEKRVTPVTPKVAEVKPVKPKTQYPIKLTLVLEEGDTLSTLLEQLNVSADESNSVVAEIRKHYNLRKLAVGQNIKVHLDAHPKDSELPTVKAMKIPLSTISSLEVARKADDKFTVKKLKAKLERKPTYAAGKIKSSLYETGVREGIPAAVIARMINAYSYDVDFQREIRSGDEIKVLFEKLQTTDGKAVGGGNVLYAKLHTGNRVHTIYRYTDKNGDSDFYSAKGESVRKGLLRTPVNGARITSRFGMRRHPILGYSKKHTGIDFGAPRGTPIYAAGDGKVTFAGRKGGYGNYLKLQHNNTYATAYAHIHRFASGIRRGKKVKQGQIIAYVGSTGRSTGPHLHYEVHKNGRKVNPSRVKFKAGNILRGKELAAFKRHVTQVNATVAALKAKQGTTVAMLDKKEAKADSKN